MQENRKKTGARSELGIGAERTAAAAGDRSSEKLRKAAQAVGNEELQRRIEQGNATRDEMLQFMVERLQTIRQAQVRELDLAKLDRQHEWAKLVADSHKEEFTKPDPTRWREVARIYEEAAYQVCRGALGRGKDLLERGVEAEKKEWGSLTKLVDTSELDTHFDAPEEIGPIQAGDACGATDVPQELRKLTDDIENVDTVAKDPPMKRRARDPWWTLWEDEEEEEDGEGGA